MLGTIASRPSVNIEFREREWGTKTYDIPFNRMIRRRTCFEVRRNKCPSAKDVRKSSI